MLALAYVCIVALVCSELAHGFAFAPTRALRSQHQSALSAKNQKVYNIEIDLGEGYKPVGIQMRPIFADSSFFTVQYDIPFGLNVDKVLLLSSSVSFCLLSPTRFGGPGGLLSQI